MELDGRVALVTGGGAGIGEAIARRLADAGATVVVADRDEDAARAVADIVGGLGVRTDVANAAEVDLMVAAAVDAFGGIDVLVNNAGNADSGAFPDATADVWRHTIDVNLLAPMHAIQAALPSLRARGGGVIVNIASLAGVESLPHDLPEYAAAKAGLIRLTTSLAGLAAEGIRVNCVAPDWVDTPTSRETRAQMTPEELATVPPVLLEPDEIAAVVLDLVTDETHNGRVVECWCGQPPMYR